MARLKNHQPASQHGFVLFMALIILVIMTVSAMAMMTMLNSGTNSAGNIAFRQASLRTADNGVEAALTWLTNTSLNNPSQLNADTSGYYAYVTYDNTNTEIFKPASFSWDTDAFALQDPNAGLLNTAFPGGYSVYYVIHRMARPTDLNSAIAGGGNCALSYAGCAAPPSATGTQTGQGLSQATGNSYNGTIQTPPGLVYYRVTVKVTGTRRNTSYVQAFLH